ncbi:MAG: acetaldehyde dehydrogenase (acetylating) [Microbacteriaceae bacterium]|nr:MAG: acetaldehyde dehydrogenase (acetylating) [Microbacteriaceae bacterium]
MTAPARVAIIGSGHIGTDLMLKVIRRSTALEMGMLVGIDSDSEGLARARRLGVAVTADGIDGLVHSEEFADIALVFDATSAAAHAEHARVLAAHGKIVVDLTPAAVGPFVVPSVNLREHLLHDNVNLVTCGGQATIPIVAAVSEHVDVHYAEIVASIASRSAGPGTRANIDAFTATTAAAIESVGGAARGKAIIVLNPAEPPVVMRDTVHVLTDHLDDETRQRIDRAITERVAVVASYVPGYRLKQAVQFRDEGPSVDGLVPDGRRRERYTRVSAFLEVEGLGMHLPSYAGNLDIMTSAALRVGEELVHARVPEASR